MPLRYFKNIETEEIIRTLKDLRECEEYEEVIKAPNGKFMVAANKGKGTSKIKDSKAVLTERARNHNRETLLDDNIAMNRDNKLGTAHNFLNEKGQRRRKIDDI